MGLEVNYREGCGITPLSLAVLNKNKDLCKFLVESGARYSGPLFTSAPSPLCMVERLQYPEILEVFAKDQEESEDENELIRHIDSTFSKSSISASNTINNDSNVNRSCSGFVTPVVGNVGTCKTNQAAVLRSGSYQWVGLCPGDLHNKGYFCEAAFKSSWIIWPSLHSTGGHEKKETRYRSLQEQEISGEQPCSSEGGSP